MKKQLQNIKAIAVLTLATFTVNAQTTADLQNLTLSPNTYWNGSTANPSVSTIGTFTSGNCIFPNTYNGNFGGFWESGWAYSNMKDSTTAGSGNQYSARTALGFTNSTIYAVGQGGSVLKFNTNAQGKQMAGFYVTNNTYAAISMRDGDTFGKKFGGVSGNDPDWFKLKVQKYLGGVLAPDSVTFYLADFRSSTNSLDYIVRSWQYVNLTSLGNVDSLLFTLSSSDNGTFGMNTPSYFCLDHFTTLNAITGITKTTLENDFSVYPNPSTSLITIDYKQTAFSKMEIRLIDAVGKEVYSASSQLLTNTINIENLQHGIYFLEVTVDGNKVVKKINKH